MSCSQLTDKTVTLFAEKDDAKAILEAPPVTDGEGPTELESQLAKPIKVVENTKIVKKYCKKIERKFKKYQWGKSNCSTTQWHHVRNSVWGTPLIWKTFGSEKQHNITSKNTTMIFCGVHGDEITPVKFCFDIIKDLEENPELIEEQNLVIVAPIVNPDSFFKRRPTRTNARGIDINRNFPTKDWKKNALKLWKSRYNSQKRRYPGKKPLSEPEVIFQVNLIKRYRPNKVISVHAPLTLLDYDGPVMSKTETQARDLLLNMSKKASGYKIKDYPFFTGSLGNYSGNEKQIPTYTLELPNSDWNKTRRFWKRFQPAIHHAIKHDFRPRKIVSVKPKLDNLKQN
ncbi:M14 family zinc carboxypeptidase [Bacteriovoracaceae bacterium]|nr:M14 family zinc carboxypeptidase [Bacteriovoracaceae bacterium]